MLNTADSLIAHLHTLANPHNVAGMARFGIRPTTPILGISVTTLRKIAREVRREWGRGVKGDHALAADLWASGIHEARTLASMLDDPAQVTPAQMDAWIADFDTWDICDQVCMNLFDKTPYAYAKVAEWCAREREFEKRAGFALMAVLVVRAKKADAAKFEPFFDLIEQGAMDDRNFVKKAVNWALRQIGKGQPALYPRALALAEKLAASEVKSARWIGRDAVRELTDPETLKRMQAKPH
jgi:3-methyladenine DNA glycosylase AlkD